MTTMNGNPHYDLATLRLVETPSPKRGSETQIHFASDALTQATLALAFEQRTANLVALYTGTEYWGEDPRLEADIKSRLGLNGDAL